MRMVLMVLVMCGWLVGCGSAVTAVVIPAPAAPGGVTMTLGVVPAVVGGGDSTLTIHLQNAGSDTFTFGEVSSPLFAIRVQVVDAEGKAVPHTRVGEERANPTAIARTIIHSVKPGEQVDLTVMLRENFEMNRAGKYTVFAEADFRVVGKSVCHVVSNAVGVEVLK